MSANAVSMSVEQKEKTSAFSLPPLEDILMAGVEDKTGIDLEGIYCTKTGQKIGRMEQEQVAMLMHAVGATRLEELAGKIALGSGVARHWIYTGAEELDKLQSIDPVGFYSFCCGLAARQFYMAYDASKQKHRYASHELEIAFYNSLVLAYARAKQMPIQDIEEANKNWRLFLFLGLHDRKNTFYKVDWANAPKEQTEELRYIPSSVQSTIALYPHTLASEAGIEWCKKELKAQLTKIVRHKSWNMHRVDNLQKIASLADLENINIASMFRWKRQAKADKFITPEMAMYIAHAENQEQGKSLRVLLENAKQAKQEQASAKAETKALDNKTKVNNLAAVGFRLKVANKE